jgi:LacI family transcriptional regulator
MPSAAPTLRTLARDLGLSRTTVSDALRGSARVDPRTAERVRRAAEAAGYRRNPLAGALMSELRRSRGGEFRGVLAAVDFHEAQRPEGAAAYHGKLAQGLGERAAELGFKLERFTAGTEGLSVPRLGSILQSRGISAVALLPSWVPPDLSALDWTHFTGVYTDYLIERPRLHAVCSDQYRSLLGALRQLRARGYRRPGLYLQRRQDERLQFRWSAAFRAFQETLPRADRTRPLVVEAYAQPAFTTWFQRERPDVVLSHHSPAIGWMEAAGARLPKTHGFACLNLDMAGRPCAGLDLQPSLLGARAAELLIAQLQRNETGIPAWPSTTMISARWTEGPTLRPAAG